MLAEELGVVVGKLHQLKYRLGVAIGAITFSGSVIAFLKLNGNMSGAPILLPLRHVLNLGIMAANFPAYFKLLRDGIIGNVIVQKRCQALAPSMLAASSSSIGVVSNERRLFANAAQVSELATEMKSYAKTLTGSVYTIDRRQDPPAGQAVRSPSARSDVPLSLGDES